MLILRIIDTNQNNYFPQKIENFSMQKIHYGGASELNCVLEENPSFQNHKVGLFNNVYLYNFSKLIWQGYITKFQRNFIKSNFTLKASGLLIDFKNKRIKKTYVLDDIGEFRNWNEKNNKQSDEILYGYSQAIGEKGVRISLLQRSYNAEEDGLFEIKIDENIERLKARILLSQPANFTTKIITLDENHSNPNEEKKWENAQKIDEDVLLDITKAVTGSGTFTKDILITKDSWVQADKPNTNRGSYGSLLTNHHGGTYDYRAFLFCPTAGIPANATIISATLHIYCNTLYKAATNYLYRVIADWGEYTITFNNQPAVSDIAKSFYNSSLGLKTVDITTAFKNWWNGAWDNYGFRMHHWVFNGDNAFNSREASVNKPYVKVKYSTPVGDVEVNKRYLQFRVECTANQAISTDKYFAQLENLKLLTTDSEVNAANILKDLLLNHTQKLDLDTTLIQDCFNFKNVELCEDLDGWGSENVSLSLENSIVKEGNHSIKVETSILTDVNPSDDAYIYMNLPTTNYGSEVNMIICEAEDLYRRRAFLKFDISSIPSNATIISAVLYVYAYASKNWNIGTRLYDVTSTWTEGAIIWNNKPTVGSQQTTKEVASSGYQDYNIITLLSKWVSGEQTNYGVRITHDVAEDNDCQFYSKENATNKPYLRVRYTAPGNIEKTLSPVQNLQNKNLFRLWVRSTITGDILKAKFAENLKYQYEPDWSCKYEADQEPPAADPIWTLTGVDYASVADGILLINKTGANECSYKREDIGHNVKGNTILARMKSANSAKTTFIEIQDGIAKVQLAIYTTKIEDWNDAANSHTVDMSKYRELWLTMKNNFWVLYVDGVFALCGETQTTSNKWFKFGMDGSANLGSSSWDYVYYYNLSFLRNKKIEKTITITAADTWEEKIIDLNNFPIATRDKMKYIQFEILSNEWFIFYIDQIRANFELTSAYYRDRTAPLNILEDILAYQDYEWTILKSGKVKFFEVDRDEIDYICPIKNLVFEENSVSYFSKIYLIYFDAMMKRQEIKLVDEVSKIPFDKEHVIGLGGMSDTGAKAIGEAQFEFHKKPRYQLSCSIDGFVFDKNGGVVKSVEIEPNKNVKFLGIKELPIFRIIKTHYSKGICRLTLETEAETTPNIMKSIIEVL